MHRRRLEREPSLGDDLLPASATDEACGLLRPAPLSASQELLSPLVMQALRLVPADEVGPWQGVRAP